MTLFQIIAVLVVLAALFGYLNYRYIALYIYKISPNFVEASTH